MNLTARYIAFGLFLLPIVGQAEYENWKHSGSLWIFTTKDGAQLPAEATLENFPLLVRLHRDYFDFSQAQPDGKDLRFSTSQGEPLAYEIEAWDSKQGTASIWVRVPKIQGDSRQEIKLHWGNAEARNASDSKAVFNASNGYLSVWHMNGKVEDEVGTLQSKDIGTSSAIGMIGEARLFPGGKGVFCGDKIAILPSGASSHSTEAWFKTSKPNTTIIGWGNEGGGRGSKIRMQLRSPPHIHIDSDFSDVDGKTRLQLGEWTHVAHTYDREDGKIYINGALDAADKPLLDIKSPARCWLGGWYDNYDYVGELDEVRISTVARSADWIKLQYENQKSLQMAVGHVVQPGDEFSVSTEKIELSEGESVTITAKADGAQKVSWRADDDGVSTLIATDRLSFRLESGRVAKDDSFTLQFVAVFADEPKTIKIPVTIKNTIPEPAFTLIAPTNWDGRKPIEVVPQISNLAEMEAKNAGKLNYQWSIENIAAIKSIEPGKLVLKRAQNSGTMKVTLSLDNGGTPTSRSATIKVKEPASDPWVQQPIEAEEQPADNQFFARNDKNEGRLVYKGKLTEPAEKVLLKLYADDKLVATESQAIKKDSSYDLLVPLRPGLITYRAELVAITGGRETIVHSAKNIVCGDAFIIDGQSNAEATDIGKDDLPVASTWIRSFGSMAGDPNGARFNQWGDAIARNRDGGKYQIGAWGIELAKRLVETHKMPICIINGAVGGSRIDVHQRNSDDPTDVTTIYGRLLWRVREARLTHGIRGVFWHQGENDQGADGPTGGYGYETYQQYFVDMAAAWKEDYPNIQHYYVFQIWPKACSMGVDGSDNKLREVQRNLSQLYSNLSVMSTLGIKPPGGCHYPLEGYGKFAELIGPLVERDHYGVKSEASITAPNLLGARYRHNFPNQIILEFDQSIAWNDSLISQIYLDGKPNLVKSGRTTKDGIILEIKEDVAPKSITYLDSASWNPDNLLYGENGIAALTFCDFDIQPDKQK